MEAKTISKAYFISTTCFALVVLFSTICLCIDCDSKKWMSLNIFITTLAILPLIVFRIAVEESYKSQIETLKQQHQDEVCFQVLFLFIGNFTNVFDNVLSLFIFISLKQYLKFKILELLLLVSRRDFEIKEGGHQTRRSLSFYKTVAL